MSNHKAIKTLQAAVGMISSGQINSSMTELSSVLTTLESEYGIPTPKQTPPRKAKKFYIAADSKITGNPYLAQIIAKLNDDGFIETKNIDEADIIIQQTIPYPIPSPLLETNKIDTLLQNYQKQERTYQSHQNRHARRAFERANRIRQKQLNTKYIKHK